MNTGKDKENLMKLAKIVNYGLKMNLTDKTLQMVVDSIDIEELRQNAFQERIAKMRHESEHLAKTYKKKKCDECDETKGLIFHHRVPVELIPEEMNSDPSMYITLCKAHHRQLHIKMKKAVEG